MSSSQVRIITALIIFLSTLSLFVDVPPRMNRRRASGNAHRLHIGHGACSVDDPWYGNVPCPSPTASTGDAGSGVLIRKAKPGEIGKKATCPCWKKNSPYRHHQRRRI